MTKTIAIAIAALLTSGTYAIAQEGSTAPMSPANSSMAPSSQSSKSMSSGGTESATTGQAMTDAGITTKLKAKLLADESTSGLKIHVETNNGVVTLSGDAKTVAEKARAEQVALATDGVSKVNNKLEVRVQ